MLVEVDTVLSGPMLFEVKKAYAGKTLFSRQDKGTTVLDSTSYMFSEDKYTIDLPYDQFRWAYARSVRDGEPFLDVKQDNLLKIKQDYAQSIASGAIHDGFPHRPG